MAKLGKLLGGVCLVGAGFIAGYLTKAYDLNGVEGDLPEEDDDFVEDYDAEGYDTPIADNTAPAYVEDDDSDEDGCGCCGCGNDCDCENAGPASMDEAPEHDA